MVQINFALREVNCKIVYYGPGMSGKTTNLEIVHKKAPETNKGELTSIATEGDRTLFFDFMPLDLGTIAGMRTRFQLYTVPGQVYYNSTRKLVLQGVDGVVFVADSSESKMEENLESLENLKNNLAEYGKDIRELPIVLQYNKRDLPDALPVDQLNARLNPWGVPYFEAVAITGEGVFPTLKCLSGMVLETLNRDHREAPAGAARPAAAAAGASSSGVPASSASATAVAPLPADAMPKARISKGGTIDELNAIATRQAAGHAGPQAQAIPQASHSAPSSQGAGGGSANQTGKWKSPNTRKVDATPLPAQPAQRPAALPPRQVTLPVERSVPWVTIGLGALILAAVGAILFSTGLVGF
ncbi:MAG: hypothetical protein HMLKMBBP_00333 [Planctomycetes bacterium]|nr:hypothetical protein [Planctomycetota bacterium]